MSETPVPPELAEILARVREAAARGQALCLQGHGSKTFYGGDGPTQGRGQPLSTLGLAGVPAYEPSELYVSVGAGMPLVELEALLAREGQQLAFEPPRLHGSELGHGTIGGMVAAGLSGPARASAGALRDHVLGLSLINGRGELLHFGGTVMKNVAGYDLSRLMVGALGTLGLITEVTLKVLPRPPATLTLRFDMDQPQALAQLNRWGGQPLPLSASAWWEGALVLRLAGAEAAVQAARQRLGGEEIPPAMAAPFWQGLRDQQDEFFIGARRAVQGGAALWRLSLPSTAPALALRGEQLVEWGGAQRWVVTPMAPAVLREMVGAAGGHATLFRALDKRAGVFTPLSAPLTRIHRELKARFDPQGVFNPGRLYPEL